MIFLHWTDRAGVTHMLRRVQELTAAEWSQLSLLRRQAQYAVGVLDASFDAPAVDQAPAHMMKMQLRMLLPQATDEEIATFEATAFIEARRFCYTYRLQLADVCQ
jgi:hypothetical protein